MKPLFTFLFATFSVLVVAQQLSSLEILDRSIKYHDPMGNWENFRDTLFIVQTTPERPESYRKIFIDKRAGTFGYSIERGQDVVNCYLTAETCEYTWNGQTNIPDTIVTQQRLTRERAEMYRDYYLYLYGLPMKLKDKGTILHESYDDYDFYGRESYRLKVTYQADVGEDTWYFYIDRKTFALVAYQFFHDESKFDGEYILLEKEKTIQGIKMPQNRSWYTNKEKKLLGVDKLR
jgi:hypothetical protein